MSAEGRKWIQSLTPEEVVAALGCSEVLKEVGLAIVQELNERDGVVPCWRSTTPSGSRCDEPGQHETEIWAFGQYGGHGQEKFYGCSGPNYFVKEEYR